MSYLPTTYPTHTTKCHIHSHDCSGSHVPARCPYVPPPSLPFYIITPRPIHPPLYTFRNLNYPPLLSRPFAPPPPPGFRPSLPSPHPLPIPQPENIQLIHRSWGNELQVDYHPTTATSTIIFQYTTIRQRQQSNSRHVLPPTKASECQELRQCALVYRTSEGGRRIHLQHSRKATVHAPAVNRDGTHRYAAIITFTITDTDVTHCPAVLFSKASRKKQVSLTVETSPASYLFSALSLVLGH